jgi:hypothetical protein
MNRLTSPSRIDTDALERETGFGWGWDIVLGAALIGLGAPALLNRPPAGKVSVYAADSTAGFRTDLLRNNTRSVDFGRAAIAWMGLGCGIGFCQRPLWPRIHPHSLPCNVPNTAGSASAEAPAAGSCARTVLRDETPVCVRAIRPDMKWQWPRRRNRA